MAADSSMSQAGKVPFDLSSSRRAFLKSLSGSAIALPLHKIVAFARPIWRGFRCFSARGAFQSAAASNDLGVSFIDVARDSRLHVKTVYGGGHINQYTI